MSTKKPFFVMILFPSGPKPMVSEQEDPSDPQVVFFATVDEADDACRASRTCTAYGAEIFQLGRGDPA